MTASPSTPPRQPRFNAAALAWPAILALLTAARLGVAAALPLSPDEAYYWVWSRALAPGYLDHPPMVALWVRIGTLVAGETELGVRLLAPLAAAAGSLLLADAARALWGRGAGPRAAVLLNATAMLGVGAVTMTPDTPLLFFWVACAWALARIAAGGGGAWWLVAGSAAGLAFESKYTAALLGVAALVVLARSAWRGAWPWLGAFAGAACCAPVVAWNAAHGWASFAKQGGRVADFAPARAAQFLAELVGGQLGLATPGVAVLFALAAWGALRRARDARWALCAALVWPGALVFAQHALGDRVQANWVAILYPGCALAAAGVGARWWRGAAAVGAALVAVLYVQATLAPVPLPRAIDPAVRLGGWDALARAVAGRTDGFVASESYAVAASLAWSQPGVPVVGAEGRWALFDLPRAPAGEGVLLTPARRREDPDPALWTAVRPLGVLDRAVGGRVAEVFRLDGVTLRPGPGAVLLPVRRGRASAPGGD